MMAVTHQMLGLTFGLVAISICSIFQIIPNNLFDLTNFLVLVLFGSLLPDLDTPKSKLGRKVPIISYPMNWIFGHRKITHSLLFVVITLILGILIGQALKLTFSLQIALAIGTLSHILGDYVTNNGVPLFAPFSKKRYKFFVTFNTNSLTERFVSLFLLIFNLWFIKYLYQTGYFFV